MALIDKDRLYKHAIDLETEAFHMCQTSDSEMELLKWSIILTERTAFKYDVASAQEIFQWTPVKERADRPQGEWIEVTNGRGGHECSNCHAYAPSYMSGDEHLSGFCPNCGARMKGADDE